MSTHRKSSLWLILSHVRMKKKGERQKKREGNESGVRLLTFSNKSDEALAMSNRTCATEQTETKPSLFVVELSARIHETVVVSQCSLRSIVTSCVRIRCFESPTRIPKFAEQTAFETVRRAGSSGKLGLQVLQQFREGDEQREHVERADGPHGSVVVLVLCVWYVWWKARAVELMHFQGRL